MQLSGLVLLLGVFSAACFDIEIAPPKLGLRRLFRRPYKGPICVIEIVGAELKPVGNRGTARSLYPVALPPLRQCAPGCAPTLDEPLSHTKPSTKLSDEAADIALEYVSTRTQVASTGAVPSACCPRARRICAWSGSTGRPLAIPRSRMYLTLTL